MNALDHNTGLEVLDLQSNADFRARPYHHRDTQLQLTCLQRLARTFAETPVKVLQELSDVACSLCQADSAGISLETVNQAGEPVFHWAATSGQYAPYLDAMLPHTWMPCGVTLERMAPQLIRVPPAHFLAMGIEPPPAITDGMLIPWKVQGSRGTIWILAHGRSTAFDAMDYQIMQTLSDFAAMAIRHQIQQKAILHNVRAAAAAETAHELAHQINNPLQKIINSVFLAASDAPGAQHHIQQAAVDLEQLIHLVQKFFAVSAPQRFS